MENRSSFAPLVREVPMRKPPSAFAFMAASALFASVIGAGVGAAAYRPVIHHIERQMNLVVEAWVQDFKMVMLPRLGPATWQIVPPPAYHEVQEFRAMDGAVPCRCPSCHGCVHLLGLQ